MTSFQGQGEANAGVFEFKLVTASGTFDPSQRPPPSPSQAAARHKATWLDVKFRKFVNEHGHGSLRVAYNFAGAESSTCSIDANVTHRCKGGA